MRWFIRFREIVPTERLRFAPELILFVYVLLFFAVKRPYDPHDRVIISDGKAYYAYLTAAFIYHDFSYRFVEDYESKYYPDHPSIFKEFRYRYKDAVVNKGYPGLAFLLLPFFLVAHGVALLTGLPADGYSLIYQYFMGFAALFYFWLGLRFTQKLLHDLTNDERIIAFILLLIAFGTNLIYYTLKEGLMPHVYNFCLIAAFLFYLKRFSDTGKLSWLSLTALIYGLIVVTRPTNLLVILLLPFVAGSGNKLREWWQLLLKKPLTVIGALLPGMVFPLATMLIWYVQSGYWYVWSYGDEGFNFDSPQIIPILFSFNKGWWVYTPIALLSMTGLIWLYRHENFRFWWVVAFLSMFIYVASSWWVWTYTSNFGNRTFIDIYALVALLLGYAWFIISPHRMLARTSIILSIMLTLLSCVQFYQHYTYVFPPGKITRAIYLDSFFRLKPRPLVYYPEGYIVRNVVYYNDFEKDYGWLNYKSVTDEHSYEGCCSSKTGKHGIYSIGLYERIDTLFQTDYRRVRVSSWIYSDRKDSQGVLVIQLDSADQMVYYKPFFMREYSKPNRWSYMETAIAVEDTMRHATHLRVYFHNPDTTENFFVDNLKVEIVSLSIDY